MKTSTTLGGATGTSPSRYFPLSSLTLSADNVRKGEASGIQALAAMIEAQGLLQALQVTAQTEDGTATGRYCVQAGGRRLRALQWLHSKGRIASDHPVECKLIDTARAVEVSLTENTAQEPMHPADEFDAFAALASKGQSLESIAAKFGCTVLHIQRRLKLANVAPVLLDQYRTGAITLEQIMALASVDDHERQLLTWNGLSPYNRHPQNLKRKLTEDEVISTDSRVVVVGLENYLNAGGSVRADLFSTDGDQYLTDMGLLELMLGEQLQAQAEAVRSEGWAWVDVVPSYGYEERQLYCRLPKTYAPETQQQAAQRTAIEEEVASQQSELEDLLDGEEVDEAQEQALESRIDALQDQLDAMEQAREVFDPSSGGAVVTLDEDRLTVHRGLIRQADRKRGANFDAAANAAPNPASARPDVPEKLMMDLTSHRTAAIQASLLRNQRVALAALAHKMADSLFGNYLTSPLKVSLSQSRSALEKNSPTLAASRAAREIDAQRQAWKDRLPEDFKEWFGWFLEQPQAVVLDFIVFASASSIEAVLGRVDAADPAQALAQALSLDMADWWEATAETYFTRVPKSKLVAAVAETSGEKTAQEIEKMKKPDAVRHAVEHTQGRRWLPQPLRSPCAVVA